MNSYGGTILTVVKVMSYVSESSRLSEYRYIEDHKRPRIHVRSSFDLGMGFHLQIQFHEGLKSDSIVYKNKIRDRSSREVIGREAFVNKVQ